MIGKVKVLGNELTFAKSASLDSSDVHGLYDSTKAKIFIRTELDHNVERHTVLHELAHDMIFRLGFENDLDRPAVERMCDGFAVYVRDLVRNNPQLIEYLKEK